MAIRLFSVNIYVEKINYEQQQQLQIVSFVCICAYKCDRGIVTTDIDVLKLLSNSHGWTDDDNIAATGVGDV